MIKTMQEGKKHASDLSGPLLRGVPLLYLALFLVVPLFIIVGISFLSRGEYGELSLPLTLESYKRLAGFSIFGFEPLYPTILFRSLGFALPTAVICVALGMPLAFFIARLPKRWRSVALILVVIPFWTNLLIRTYAWQILLAPEGSVVAALGVFGIRFPDDGLYPGVGAVLVGMVCDYLPFFVLPVYASIEKIDWTLAEAAADLGANRWNVFRFATLPQIVPGLTAGLMMVFLPATGQFVVSDLLGGAKTFMLGNAVQQQFGQSRDWPFGAAIAVVGLVLVLLASTLFLRRSRTGREAI